MNLTTAEAIERLERVGVPCAPIADYGQVFSDEHLAARDFFWDAPHRAPARCASWGRRCACRGAPPRRGAAAPMLGAAHARRAARSRLHGREIDALVAARAAAVSA